jgi:hypothetical protein
VNNRQVSKQKKLRIRKRIVGKTPSIIYQGLATIDFGRREAVYDELCKISPCPAYPAYIDLALTYMYVYTGECVNVTQWCMYRHVWTLFCVNVKRRLFAQGIHDTSLHQVKVQVCAALTAVRRMQCADI